MRRWSARAVTAALTTAVTGGVLLTSCGARPPSLPSPADTSPAVSAPGPSSAAPSTGPTSTGPTITGPTSTGPTSTGPTSTDCPNGTYKITGLTGHGAAARLGTGTGGSLTMAFDGGRFTLGSAGTTPMKLDLGAGSAELRIDGTITGSYSGGSGNLTMTTTDANGSATISGLGIDRRVSLRSVADQLLPGTVTGTATCTDQGAELDLPSVTLQLAR